MSEQGGNEPKAEHMMDEEQVSKEQEVKGEEVKEEITNEQDLQEQATREEDVYGQNVDEQETTVASGIVESDEVDQLNIDQDDLSLSDPVKAENEISVKHPKKRWKFILAVVLVSVLIVTAVGQVIVRANPVFRTYSAVLAMSKKNVLDTKTTVQTDFAHIIDNFLENIIIETYSHVNKKESETSYAITASYDNKSIIDLLMIIKEETLFLDIPQVLDDDEYLFVDMEDMMEDMMNVEDYNSGADIYKYMDMIDYDSLDAITYAEAIYNELEDHIDSTFNTVTYEITIESALNLVETLLDIMEDDEDLYEWFVDNATNVLEAMIEDDFSLGEFTVEDYEAALNTIQENDFEDTYFEFIEECQDEIDVFVREFESLDMLGMNYGYIITYHFNLFNQLKQMDVKFDMKMFGSMTITTEYGKTYNFDRAYDDSDGQDVYEYIEAGDLDAFTDIGDDVVDYFEDYLDENQDLDEFLSDEYGFFVTMIQEAIANMTYMMDSINQGIYY